MLVHWIWLATRPDIGDGMKCELLRHFQDPEDLFFAEADDLAQVEGLPEKAVESLKDKNLLPAEEILSRCADKGIQLLTYRDAAYPNRLKNIPDPPLVLYYKGRLPDFDGLPLIGVVGTRKATAYGLGIAKRMGYQIASCGGIVVSGLAFGIDGLAMRGALTAGMPVVGVLGCGADVVYPVSNRSLYADTEQHGCLLTEFPPGTPPMKWNFPKRNRIISGLSCGVLVVEAPEKSGALITARQAADQGRDVFVVPGNIDVETCAGSNALLRDGAMAVSSGWDILSEYESLFPGKIRRDTTPSRQAAYPDEIRRAEAEAQPQNTRVAQKARRPGKKKERGDDKIDVDNRSKAPYIDVNDPLKSLSPEEQAILDTLGSDTRLVDDVIAECGLPAGTVLATLTLLEVRGLVTRLPGKRIRTGGKKS